MLPNIEGLSNIFKKPTKTKIIKSPSYEDLIKNREELNALITTSVDGLPENSAKISEAIDRFHDSVIKEYNLVNTKKPNQLSKLRDQLTNWLDNLQFEKNAQKAKELDSFTKVVLNLKPNTRLNQSELEILKQYINKPERFTTSASFTTIFQILSGGDTINERQILMFKSLLKK